MRMTMAVMGAATLLVSVLAVSGCAGIYQRTDKDELGYLERAETQTEGNLEVTVSVLTAEESKQLFGVPLANRGVQPVWVRIRNNDAAGYYFYTIDLDPEYFSAHEAAWRNHFSFARIANTKMDSVFRQHQIHRFVQPDHTISGFVFTNLDEGAKVVNVVLLSTAKESRNFLFTVPVPGITVDERAVEFDTLYRDEEILEIEDLDTLRAWIEDLPCCVFGPDGMSPGDPLNLVIIGHRGTIQPAFLARGWYVTEAIHAGSVWKTVKSFLFGSKYRYSPVSPLYLHGRPHDRALQKARDTVDERNHLRLWLAPARYQGMDILVGQISRDIGVRFTGKISPLTTHVIDPEVDEARWYLAQDLVGSQRVAAGGLAKGVGAAPPEQPRYNLLNDPYYTDGMRLVAIFTDEPTAITEIEDLHWETPSDIRRVANLELE